MGFTNLLEVKNLSISFGNEPLVVNEVSFNINKGESVALVGESGSGKTLTALAILNLLPRSAQIKNGRIILNDTDKLQKNLFGLNETELQKIRGNKIAMIFQEPMSSLNPSMTCGIQATEALLIHKNISPNLAKVQVLELFNEVRLPRVKDIFKSYPHQLSGGQRQRVMIAMAMSCHPQLLIADEPTTALDVTVQKTILGILKHLQAKYNMSLLFVTHDLGIVSEISEKLIVMRHGKIVEQGITNYILNSPENVYTKGLIACRPPLHKKPYRLTTIENLIQPERKKIQENKTVFHSESPLLEIKNLSTEFTLKRNFWGAATKTIKAVHDISFEVFKGEVLGIVGESGCGKTTLGRGILQLVKPGSGQIVYKGQVISNLKASQFRTFRKQLQIIFQNPYSSLNPKLTAGEILMEPLIFHGLFKTKAQRKNRVLELLRKVNLNEEHFYRYPHEFSGGQRQRIVIARALCVEPEIIICDESVSSLDVSIQAQVLNLLNDLKDEFGLTYIFISHDMAVVKYMCNRIIVMNEGRLEEQGEAEQLFASPVSSVTKNLIASIPGFQN